MCVASEICIGSRVFTYDLAHWTVKIWLQVRGTVPRIKHEGDATYTIAC